MAVKIDMDMPKCCNECPCFVPISGTELGRCNLLPLYDLDKSLIMYQSVHSEYKYTNGCEQEGRSIHCKLKEVK